MTILLDLEARPVIGHRGAAAYAPENTLSSFRRALDLGADALELDVRLSRDGQVVVHHDPELDRCSNGSGPLQRLSAAELAQLDAGFHFVDAEGKRPYRGSGVRIPRLGEVIAEFPGVPLLIEVKERQVAEPLAELLAKTGAATRSVVAGSEWRALTAFGHPPFTVGASERDIARLFFGYARPNPACRCYAVPFRHHGLRIPTRRVVAAAHRRQATVHVWTIDDAGSALEVWRAGGNGIVTNRPDVVRAARGG
jgi:glycerophosphoryl diester phosphodiesterase